jgi:hypothetical protein
MFKPAIYIENERLDLFEDENISVVSSVQNIEDISRTFNDYSQSFTVPASPNNNKIFKHFYNASVNNGFDARVRHDAWIDIQTVPFKTGTIRLEHCEIKGNKPQNYRLTFFGQLIDLKEVIGDDYLSVLDLSDYDIAYTSDNVITGIVTGYSTQDYVFPLISTERQWFYNSNIGVTTFEDRLANIAWNGSGVDHGMNWTSFRPALKIMRIIEAIETKYEITFSRDFLGTTPFDNLYLWLANQDSAEALKSKYILVDYDTVTIDQPSIGGFDNTTGKWTPTPTGAAKVRNIVFETTSVDGVAYRIQIVNGDQVLQEVTGTGNLSIDLDTPAGIAVGSEIYCRVITTAAKTITLAEFEIEGNLFDSEVFFADKANFSVSGTTANTYEFMPKLKIIDFLKSIRKAYNLAIVPTSSTAFYLQTLDDWYAEGLTYDISAFVDTSEVKVSRAKIFKDISFIFQEPETILAEEFKRMNNTAYGDLETRLYSRINGVDVPLDGGEFEIELDFEQMVYEKLIDLDDDSATNIVYGLSLDSGLSDTVPEAHLLYIQQKSVSANPLSIVQDDGTKAQLNGNVFMPAHANSSTAEYATTFGSAVDEHTGAYITNSLYKLYYEDYITDSFSSKRRMYDLTARLPVWLLNKLKLNDKLIIGTVRYIINQMTVNVTNQMVEFELLNDIYNTVSDLTVQEEIPTPPTEPPVLTGTSFSLSATGGATRLGGCSQVPNATKYAGTVPPNLGTFIYNDVNLTSSYNGGDQYYKIAGGVVIRINPSGIVTDVYTCP